MVVEEDRLSIGIVEARLIYCELLLGHCTMSINLYGAVYDD